jgi:hypothetical protein
MKAKNKKQKQTKKPTKNKQTQRHKVFIFKGHKWKNMLHTYQKEMTAFDNVNKLTSKRLTTNQNKLV